jgi:hypothetical protein
MITGSAASGRVNCAHPKLSLAKIGDSAEAAEIDQDAGASVSVFKTLILE